MPNKMERFSQAARRAMTAAQQEATRLGHPRIGPEHLLLGLLGEESSMAYRVLLHYEVSAERVRSGIDISADDTAVTSDPTMLDLAQETKEVLELAVDEARRMGHSYIGTEHLLLGMLRQPNDAMKILMTLSIEPDSLREEVRQFLTQEPVPDDEAAAADQAPLNLAKLHERHIRLMQDTCTTLGAMLADLSQEDASTWRDQNDAPQGWTVVEVLCHLADFNDIFFTRARQMRDENHPTLEAYDHGQLAVEKRYNEQDLQAVYTRLVESRRHFVAFFEALDESQWTRSGIHPEYGRVTLLDALTQVGTHESNHIAQISRILRDRKA